MKILSCCCFILLSLCIISINAQSNTSNYIQEFRDLLSELDECYDELIVECGECKGKCVWCSQAIVPSCQSGDIMGPFNETMCTKREWYYLTCAIAGDGLFQLQETYLLIIVLAIFALFLVIFIVYCIISSVTLSTETRKLQKARKKTVKPKVIEMRSSSAKSSTFSDTSTEYSSMVS